MYRECSLCHNWQPDTDFLILVEQREDGVTTYYNHPNCRACRAMLESFGIEQKPPR